MPHLLLLLLCVFSLLKGKINSSSYGLLAKFALYAKCIGCSSKYSASFFVCQGPKLEACCLACTYEMAYASKARMNKIERNIVT